jgi:hypothetical protein
MSTVVSNALPIDEIRNSMAEFMVEHNLERVDPEPIHYHTPDLYGRRIVVPAGVVFTTKVHKSDHIAVCLRGYITVVDELGIRVDVQAPDVFVTPKGTQRFIYVHEEVEWLTVHHCEEQEMDKVEKALVCETMEEYNRLLEAPQ